MRIVDMLPLIAIAGVFWLLILRPAKKRQQAQAKLQAGLAPGKRVMTTAGMLGTVVSVDADEVELLIADSVIVKFVPAAIGKVLPDPEIDDELYIDSDELALEADDSRPSTTIPE